MEAQLLKKGIIPAINYHLWKSCNFRCKFCFGTFRDVKENNLPKQEAIKLIKSLAEFGFEKITFSGGEPTLCPYLVDLIKTAKEGNMTTTIVTNGSELSKESLMAWLDCLDWIALSIDSLDFNVNQRSGRVMKNDFIGGIDYLKLAKEIKRLGYKLKINTVVSTYNKDVNLNDFIQNAKPDRWKIMQALHMKRQNDRYKNSYSVTNEEFNDFISRHNYQNHLKESNYDMKGSYLMIDPLGRFFSNLKGEHTYSSPINEVGVEKALNEIDYCFKKFIGRSGLYNWK